MAPFLNSQPRRLLTGLALGLGLAGGLATATPARAVGTIPAIYGTGVSSTGQSIDPQPTGSTRSDVNWSVVQYPNNAGSPPAAAQAPVNVPNPWIGSVPGQTNDNFGSTINGVTYRWISASTAINAASTSVPGYGLNPVTGLPDFSYILQQTFNVTTAGRYHLSLNLIGDNETSFYINGSIIGGNTVRNPTISGGTLIGTSDTGQGNLGKNYTIGNWTNLQAGTNTAYLVVRDFGAFTGVLTSNVTFTQDVPAPLPLLGAGAAFGWSRRLRRRIAAGEISGEARS